MGRVRTAAAKKFIEKAPSSDDDESLVNVKRSARSKRASNSSQLTPRASTSRSSRATKSSAVNDKENGKNGVPSSSSSDSEDDAPIVNHKRKASNENASAKKAKPSTSSAATKTKPAGNKPKNVGPSKKKKKGEEERYEVEAIRDHRVKGNVKYFLIHWKGYDSSDDSWESQYSIRCPALLAKYYEDHPEASLSARKRSKKRKPVVPKPRHLKIDEQLDYNSDWDENEDYEVERIIDVYMHRNNKREFLIRWKGYSSNADSWEPEENLDCKDLIEKFMEKVEQVKNLNQKELRPVRSQTQRFTLMTQASARRLSKRNTGRQRAVYYDCDE